MHGKNLDNLVDQSASQRITQPLWLNGFDMFAIFPKFLAEAVDNISST